MLRNPLWCVSASVKGGEGREVRKEEVGEEVGRNRKGSKPVPPVPTWVTSVDPGTEAELTLGYLGSSTTDNFAGSAAV